MSESSLFLTADDAPISLEQALRYLKSSGKLESVLWEVVRQHVIEQELQQQDLAISSDVVDQIVIDFRIENQLTDYQSFQD